MTNNSLGAEGITSLSEFIKVNRSLRSLDLSNNKLNYDAARVLAASLRLNSTLQFLNVNLSILYQQFYFSHLLTTNVLFINLKKLSQNNISIPGVYELLSAVNTEASAIEYLGLKVLLF